ncbi:DUF3301 domain-containing protein [Litoribrevibacter euphylliae]|uniref:DUF3301 domain-containing protein n=1 Tax=Litoribrevibacter euphylliae TaxID=1834034 RepID=A0ABV7HK23_9GAMM
MYDLVDLVVIFALLLCMLLWWQSRGSKEVAYRAARSYCHKMDVELLDQAISLRRYWFKRDDNGTLKPWRSYYFEFSVDGSDRYQGRVIMLGQQIQKIELEPHRLH